MKPTLYLLTATFLLLSACKDDDDNSNGRPKCQTVTHAPQEFLDYWFFPQGSWWVYKLKGSEPAVYDTVRNTGRHRAFFAQPYEEAGLAKHCEMFYVHDLVHYNKDYFKGYNEASNFLGGEGLRGWRMGDKWVIDQTWDANLPNENIFFFYPFSIGEMHMADNNWVSDTNAVVTPNYTFHNSVGFFSGYGGNPDTSASPQRKIYFTKGVGITWRRYYNNQVWELVDYYINR